MTLTMILRLPGLRSVAADLTLSVAVGPQPAPAAAPPLPEDLLAFVGDRSNTGMYLALHYLPIALLAVAFSLQELPRFEIPPLPRRSAAPRWGDGSLQPATVGQATA